MEQYSGLAEIYDLLMARAVHEAFSLKPPDDKTQRVFLVAGKDE